MLNDYSPIPAGPTHRVTVTQLPACGRRKAGRVGGAVRRPGQPAVTCCDRSPGPGLAGAEQSIAQGTQGAQGEEGPLDGGAMAFALCPQPYAEPPVLGGQGRTAEEISDVAQASLLMLGAMAVITVGAIALGDWIAEFVAW